MSRSGRSQTEPSAVRVAVEDEGVVPQSVCWEKEVALDA